MKISSIKTQYNILCYIDDSIITLQIRFEELYVLFKPELETNL